MRPLSRGTGKRFGTPAIAAIAIQMESLWTCGCGPGGAQSPPPLPPSIVVSVTPASGTVVLGNQITFTARVTNTTDTAVSWSVSGVAGGNATLGTITPVGVYTAPADLPSPSTVQVTATSHADATKSGTGTLAITSDIALGLTPNSASVELGAAQAFQASVTSSGSGHSNPLDPFRPGVRERVRDGGRKRELHRTTSSPIACRKAASAASVRLSAKVLLCLLREAVNSRRKINFVLT